MKQAMLWLAIRLVRALQRACPGGELRCPHALGAQPKEKNFLKRSKKSE